MRDAGSIALTCDTGAGRTRLRAIRCEGLSRSSRAFREPDGGVRLILSTLGPGVLGGDSFTLDGAVRPQASLVACGQMATPVFAGDAPSRSAAAWDVADGATLHVAGEPLLLEPDSAHVAGAEFAVRGTGVAIVADTFALRGSAQLSMRTTATIDGRLVYRDAYEVSGTALGAFGTVALIAADPALRAAFLARAGDVLARVAGTVRAGGGETAAAAIVRLSGARVWDVRAAAFAVAGFRSP